MAGMSKAQRPGAFTKQPLKGLYVAWFIATTIVRLPLLFLYYLPRFTRPHFKYPLMAAIFTPLQRSIYTMMATVEMKTPVSLEPGKEGERFIEIKPEADANHAIYKDVCLHDPQIRPTTIGAVWYPSAVTSPSDIQGRKVIFHIHGGAYVILNAREDNYGAAMRILSKHFDGAAVLCPEYRRGAMPGGQGRFPAQLQDAITAYRHLVNTLKVPASSITFSGDSAGGHLVIMLLRYIASINSPELPLPAGAMLWSPWVDLVRTPDAIAAEMANNHTDIIPAELIEWGIREFTGNGSVAPSDPYVSPMQAPFKISIPVWVARSPTEVLSASIGKWAGAMQKSGSNVSLYDLPPMPHDIVGWIKGGLYQEELVVALAYATKFLDKD